MQQEKKFSFFNIAIIVAALGYFVDIYDLLLFTIVKKPSMLALGATDATMLAWFTDVASNNNLLTNVSDAKLIQPYNYLAFDPTPFAGSNGNTLINSGASFTDSKVAVPFFTPVTFRGGIAPAGVESNWWKGWTKF